MASITLVYRPSARKGRHAGSLSLRLIHERKVKTITLKGCRIMSDEWDQDTHSILIPSDNPSRAIYLRAVISRINDEKSLINGLILSLESKGRYSLDNLLGLLQPEHDESSLQEYVETLANTLMSRGQIRAARSYRTVTHGLFSFLKKSDIPLTGINARLIKDFESYLKNEGRMLNTISYYMRNLQAIYNKAVQEKLIIARNEENPFADVFTGVVKTVVQAPSMDEIRQLLNIDFEDLLRGKPPGSREYAYFKNLWDTQRYFSFCLYARGMCFVDLAYLKKSDIQGNFIRYSCKKTDQQIDIRIITPMQSIIDSFADEASDSPYVFPLIRQLDKPSYVHYETVLRTQNNRMKELSILAGIDKTISMHAARHMWATIEKSLNI
ncbi:site-specific integrase [Bacteroides sp. 51]|uniref:tyrosine-type recombinase/integrase n=1 Tax=Bacteroides sp. 51 TaxID=2302938 RepID=UPI0013D306F2|nr:site-specific integrase [Bacteroides sp. 51]NDV81165.1 hypothetical protein [Bacteroides sp. 51]